MNPPLSDRSADVISLEIAQAIEGVRPIPGHARLMDALDKRGLPLFALRLSRGGWHRPGRIIDAEGVCVSENAQAWLEAAFEERDDPEPEAFLEEIADQGLQVTRYVGQTHYFVHVQGNHPEAFWQLEIEELDEAHSHGLNPDEALADSLETLLEPAAGVQPGPAFGKPVYHLRRLTDIAAFIHALREQPGKPAPVLRFIDDWAKSSAGQQNRLCEHWVFALSEYLDRYRQRRLGALPVAATRAPQWSFEEGLRGTELAQCLHEYDRNAGYGFAWYFHMLSGRKVPRNLPAAVFSDIQDDLAYLPERDARLVRDWMHQPYSVP
jgi:hypothetical protein